MSEFLAEARVLIRPDTTAFRIDLEKQLAAATAKPVVVPVRAQVVDAGSSAGLAAANAKVASTARTATVATEDLAGAEVTQAAAARAAAREEAAHARTLASVEKAAFANSAAMLGLRGAVLTASAAFLGATVAFQAVGKSIKAASDANEEFNKTAVVFGDAAEQIQDFAKTTATSLGISNVEALRAAGIFGNLFRSINILPQAAADMSQALVTLASDLASFNNADPSEVLANIRSGLAGEPEPLRKFGIFLSQARAQQEALIDTGKKSVKDLTNAEIVQARYNIILRDSNIAAGDFARTQGGLANQTRTLNAQVSDLSATFGRVLTPILTDTVSGLNDVVKGAGRLTTALEDLAAKAGIADDKSGSFFQQLDKNAKEVFLSSPIVNFTNLLERFGDQTDEASKKASGFHFALGGLQAEIAAMNAVAAQVDFTNIIDQLNALEVAQLQIQTGRQPGGRAAEEANLRQQIAEDNKAIDAAKSGSKERRRRLEELAADQRALEALQKEDAQELEDASRARKAAADKARQAQEDADRAFLDLLSNRRDDQARRVARAGETAGLQDDIRAQNNLQALIQQQIAKIRERVRNAEDRKAAIRELRIALIASRAEEEKLREEQKAQAQSAAQEILDLRIQTAEAKGQIALEKTLLNEKIRRLKLQIKAAKGQRLLVAQLRLELAQTQKQLADLNKQQEDANKKGKTLQQSQFEFLQTQQGFAANLLGNLIPGFATAGLVGNSQRQGDVQTAVKTSAQVKQSSVATVRPVQVDTTNALLRQILAALQGRQTQPPEARYQRHEQRAAFDGVHGG